MTSVPDRVHGHRRAGHRHRCTREPAQHAQAQQAGQGREPRGATQEGRHAGEVRHQGHEATLDTSGAEHAVDLELARRLVGDRHVIGVEVLGQAARRLARVGVVEHAPAVVEQALAHDVGRVRRAWRDHQEAAPVAQHLHGGCARRNHPQRHAGRAGAHALEQQRQQQVALQIVGRDRQARAPGHRLEAFGGGETTQFVQDRARLYGERLGARSRHDASARLHDHRVVDQTAQLLELVTHRRLRDAESLGGARHRRGLDDRDQHLQQMAVDGRLIDFAHG